MDAIRMHWDTRSVEYNDFVVKGYADLRERRAWQNHFASVLGNKPLNILDVGCGPGIISMQLADLGHHVTSVDISDRMVEFAKENASANNLDIDIRRGDAMELPFEDSSFDAVVSGYMLWTVPDPEKVVSEWFRVLKPGCRLMYTDGDWFNDPKSTKFRNSVSGFFSRRDRRHLEEVHESGDGCLNLWSSSAKRPEYDLELLSASGFGEISVINNVQKKVLHGSRYYAYGFTNNHFSITAVKPYERCSGAFGNRMQPGGIFERYIRNG